MKEKSPKDEVQIAFELLEHVYTRYNNDKTHESNKYPLGHPDRVEHDFSEREKEHLALLRSKLHMVIAEKINKTITASSESSDRLGKKVFWLNIVIAIFTAVLALTAIIELKQ